MDGHLSTPLALSLGSRIPGADGLGILSQTESETLTVVSVVSSHLK